MKKLHKVKSVAGAFSALMLLFLLSACERNLDPDLNRIGWAYYPLSLGQYHLYDVYRIDYNFTEESDTLEYELKELVSEYFLNQQGDTVYVLRRYQRTDPQAAWQLDSAYLVQRTPRWLIQTINNKPQIQLAFPVAEGLVWNANMLNSSKADSFMISHVGKPFTLDEKIYDQTLRVEQEEFLNTIVQTDQREEIFAYGVGMVYKKTNTLNYCVDSGCTDSGVISTGLYLEMKLKETGTESL